VVWIAEQALWKEGGMEEQRRPPQLSDTLPALVVSAEGRYHGP
jgi:hypothetical protein